MKKVNNEENKVNNEELKEQQKAEETSENPEKDCTEAECETEKSAEQKSDEPKSEEQTGDTDSKADKSSEGKSSEEEEALNVKYMRLMADFQNYKKRVEKEKGDIYAYANEKLVSELLIVMDNFERALQHEAADESFAEGMRMIFKQLTDVLVKAGLEEIKALGEDFDPNYHNAVMTEDNADYESGKVTEVLQKGYLLNNKVIRASMVKVNN